MARHQIYVRIPAEKTLYETKPETVIGFDHDWLHGIKAIKYLTTYIQTVINDPKNSKKSTEVVKNLARETVNILNQAECADARKIMNASGITVIDITGDKPKFAFVATEVFESQQIDSFKIRHPNDPDLGQDVYYNLFKPMTPEEYIKLHYGNNWKEHLYKQNLQQYADLKDWIEFLDQFKVLTIDDLGEIFPAMVVEEEGKGFCLLPNTLRFLDISIKPIAVKSTTKTAMKVVKKKNARSCHAD